MKKQKRAIPAALLALCLLLAACGEKQSGGPAEAPAAAAYTSELSALDLPLTELTTSAASGGNLYLAGLEEEPPEADGEEISSGSFATSSSSRTMVASPSPPVPAAPRCTGWTRPAESL